MCEKWKNEVNEGEQVDKKGQKGKEADEWAVCVAEGGKSWKLVKA